MEKIHNLNRQMEYTRKPNKAFYKKSMGEIGPTWAERRKLV